MTKDEALRLALEAFIEINKLSIGERAISLPAEIDTAMDAIKEALAQPEQDHVAYTGNGSAGREVDVKPTGFFFQIPPQRTWVGLTDEEVQKLIAPFFRDTDWLADYTRAIEDKLKEKNT